MFNLYKLLPYKDRYTSATDTLIEIRDSYGFDIIKAMYVYRNSNQACVMLRCEKADPIDRIEHNYMLSIDDIDKSFLGLMFKEKKIVFNCPDEGDDNQQYAPLNRNAKTEVYYPLCNAETNEVFGCIYLCSPKEVSMNWDSFIRDYRFVMLNDIISILYKDTKRSDHILSCLTMFNEFLAKNNPHLLTHHFNVAYMSNRIADEMKMHQADKTTLYYASLLHDIGNLYINGNILNKKEKLTDSEYRIIKNHVTYSANLAKQILMDEKNKEMIIEIIMQHHERYDGKGYPCGLKGEEIDIKSRIVSVADAVEAMLSGRSYRETMSIDRVISELKANKGTQFDPRIVDIVIKILYERTYVKSMIEEIPIMAATLSVYTRDECFQVPGILINKETWYEFHPDYTSDLDMIEWIKASHLTLSYVANRDIFEYEAKFLKIIDGVAYLSQLEAKSTMNSYSLHWEIPGVLYLDDTTAIAITTTRISGGALAFFVAHAGVNKIEKNKFYKISLNFNHNDLEHISGIVTQQYRSGHSFVYYFTYHNVPDSLKDRLIGRIFKKQVELKHRLLIDLN